MKEFVTLTRSGRMHLSCSGVGVSTTVPVSESCVINIYYPSEAVTQLKLTIDLNYNAYVYELCVRHSNIYPIFLDHWVAIIRTDIGARLHSPEVNDHAICLIANANIMIKQGIAEYARWLEQYCLDYCLDEMWNGELIDPGEYFDEIFSHVLRR